MKVVQNFNWKNSKHYKNLRITKNKRMFSRTRVITCKELLNLEEEDIYSNLKTPKFLKKAQRKDYLYNGTFHEAIGPVLVLAQCFALMPVKGVKCKDVNGLSFSVYYGRTIYSIIFLIAQIAHTGFTIYWIFDGTVDFEKFEPLIFQGTILIVTIKFLNLAKQWPKLMKKWENFELKLPQYELQIEKAVMANKIKIITFVVMMLSLTEHMLNIISIIHYANYCSLDSVDPIESVFRAQLSQIFCIFDYSPILALFGKYLNVLATFTWTFMDVFVMVISIGLSSKFKQINDRLMKVKGQKMPESFWMEARLNYRNICKLCDEIDNAISLITMISFSNNLYGICMQLLRSLNKLPSIAHAVYFWFSLSFLIGRTLTVSLLAAEINDQSKGPIQVFRSIPRESWGSEVKRFCEEVTMDTVALSGMGFFHLTRKLVLSVAGTIVTYELVLIQFREDDSATISCSPAGNTTIE